MGGDGSTSVHKVSGNVTLQEAKKRDKSAFLTEGMQLGCYHAWTASELQSQTRVAFALDCSGICGDVLGIAACVPRGLERPAVTAWLPPKVCSRRGSFSRQVTEQRTAVQFFAFFIFKMLLKCSFGFRLTPV